MKLGTVGVGSTIGDHTQVTTTHHTTSLQIQVPHLTTMSQLCTLAATCSMCFILEITKSPTTYQVPNIEEH